MPDENPEDRAWQLMEKVGICLLTTNSGDKMRCRPMGATVKRDEHAIYFLTGAGSRKELEIQENSDVILGFADTGSQKYVAVSGKASTSRDRAKIKEIWTPMVRAWWSSPDDPDIHLITVRPDGAEYWDSPGAIAAYALMLTAAVTGAKPKIGEVHKTTL